MGTMAGQLSSCLITDNTLLFSGMVSRYGVARIDVGEQVALLQVCRIKFVDYISGTVVF